MFPNRLQAEATPATFQFRARPRRVCTESDSESEVEIAPAVLSPAPQAQPQPEDVHPSSAMTSDGHLATLVSMGFQAQTANRALHEAGGNLNTAVEILLGISNPAANSADVSHSRIPVNRKDAVSQPSRGSLSGSKRQLPNPASRPHAKKKKKRRRRSDSSDDVSSWQASDDGSSSGDAPLLKGNEMSDSGSGDSVASERTRKLGTKALRELSSIAQGAILDGLTGPQSPQESEAAFRRRRVDVRQTISSGCTKLRTDFFPSSEDLIAKAECFNLLKAHQHVGVRWLLALHPVVPGMILADEMGLGKTSQTLCFLEILGSRKPSLIVAPASLLETWESEAARWTPRLRTLKYHATSQGDRMEISQTFFEHRRNYDLVITTPNVFNCKFDREVFFRKVEFEYLVCDEAHGLKNAGTARYREISRSVRSSRRLLLTGTPVQNSLAELATLLGFALSAPKGKQRVSEELREISEQPHDKALRQLQAAAAPFILRRLKADVLSELPMKHGVVIYCEMEGAQRELYNREMAICRKGTTFTKAGVKEAFHQLRRICLHPLMGKHRLSKEQNCRLVKELCQKRADFAKAGFVRAEREVQTWSDFDKHEAAIMYGLSPEFRVSKQDLLGSAKVVELLRILREKNTSDGKTLVFSQFTQLLDVVQAALTASGIVFCRLDGKTAIQDRHSIVANFQGESGPRVFLISMKAGGVGLNLTAASTVVMLDLDFNPQNSRQAEDRVHRLGQSRQVTVYYLICRDTVEDMVLKRNVDKMQLDRQFGARRTALETAVEKTQASGVCEETENDTEATEQAAEAYAKECEKKVMQQLQQLLKGSATRAAS